MHTDIQNVCIHVLTFFLKCHMHTHIRMNNCMYKDLLGYKRNTCTYTNTYTNVCIIILTCMLTYTKQYTNVYMYVNTRANEECMSTYTRVQKHMHTHTHKHA